jgi:predicted kinase
VEDWIGYTANCQGNSTTNRMRTLYVFRGPCGAGKSWFKERAFPEEVPRIDMADIDYALPYKQRMDILKQRFSEITGDEAVLEGIFAPHSPSWNQVKRLAYEMKFEVVSVTIVAPLNVCLERRKGDEGRTSIIHKYHHQFQ